MKKNLIFLFLISLTTLLFGQTPTPVQWKFEATISPSGEKLLQATASIDKGWVIYSQFTDDSGPVPTQFFISDQPVKWEEKSKTIKEFDDLFDAEVIKIKNSAVFQLPIKDKSSKSIKGYVTYMTCDGESCLPPKDVPFNISIQ